MTDHYDPGGMGITETEACCGLCRKTQRRKHDRRTLDATITPGFHSFYFKHKHADMPAARMLCDACNAAVGKVVSARARAR